LAHAASAFYPSGFTEAAILVVDGSGDGVSTSFHHGTAGGLKRLREYPATQSLGYFYETVAEHLDLGESTNGAGKLMGLAAYGEPLLELPFLPSDLRHTCLIDMSRHGLTPDFEADYPNPPYYARLKNAYAEAFSAIGVPKRHRNSTQGTNHELSDFSPGALNFAASAQRALEWRLLELARELLSLTHSTHLCLAGGVALNCAANGSLNRSSGASKLFVQPIAGDAGCAIGAALECARVAGALSIPAQPMTHTALGPEFTDEMIRADLDAFRIRHEYCGRDVFELTAQEIARGAIVGWFQGPCEAGPRALGHRSIIADPRNAGSRDRINRLIKRRAPWRPLAPSILASFGTDFIIDPGPADFMVVAYEATPFAKSTIPAVVHVDGSIRPQLVRDDMSSPYGKLIQAFYALTNVPVLLNTSFNRQHEPIVCSPGDALRTFFSTPLDVLVMGSYLVRK
jgi:carbamoyltransferase